MSQLLKEQAPTFQRSMRIISFYLFSIKFFKIEIIDGKFHPFSSSPTTE